MRGLGANPTWAEVTASETTVGRKSHTSQLAYRVGIEQRLRGRGKNEVMKEFPCHARWVFDWIINHIFISIDFLVAVNSNNSGLEGGTVWIICLK
jgi:hypothetical protein